jgi:hypothetical protein
MTVNVTKLAALKADQAKLILVDMLRPENDEIDEVVLILKEMPDDKSAKIIREFQTPEEIKQISEVLRLMREGSPVADMAAATQQQLDQPGPPGT